jgi:hypothetical protein
MIHAVIISFYSKLVLPIKKFLAQFGGVTVSCAITQYHHLSPAALVLLSRLAALVLLSRLVSPFTVIQPPILQLLS